MSRPDAEIVLSGGELIVIDAKYYKSELSQGTIEKTVDDMKLRRTNWGLLVCSDETKTTIFEELTK